MIIDNAKIEAFRDGMSEKVIYGAAGDSQNGVFDIPFEHNIYRVIASNGGGWEHVSVSGKKMPSWKVMCFIKSLFWNKDETVLQFHPNEAEYINNHPRCLHLWKPIGKEIELPPSVMLGFKGFNPKEI